MRGLVLLLLIGNGLYFFWQVFLAENPAVASDSKSAGVVASAKRLSLVNEPEILGAAQCVLLGSLEHADKATALVQRLTSLDIEADVESRERTLGADYWVYVKPPAVKEAATRMLRDLTAFELQAHMILEGELQHGISLGTFAHRGQAEQVMQKAQRAGTQPYLQLLPRVQSEYWVRVGAESARLIDQTLTARLAKDFPGLTQQAKPCEGVAKATDIQ